MILKNRRDDFAWSIRNNFPLPPPLFEDNDQELGLGDENLNYNLT